MRIDILTIFPEMFENVLSSSMLGRAAAKGILEFHAHNIRDYSDNKHRNTDDYPFGGGAGMVMLAMVLTSVGLPVEGIALVAGVDRIFDMGRTTVNITGDASCCMIVSNMEKKKEARLKRS